MMRLLASWFLAVALLVGCSPYVYREEVSSFGDGVVDLHRAYVASAAAVEAAAQDAERARWRLGRKVLGPSRGCVADLPPDTMPCVVVPKGGTPRPPSPAALAADRTMAAMDALLAYAQNLDAVVDAGERERLDAATLALRADAVALAERATEEDDARARLVGPIVRLFDTVVAVELDRRRLEALRAGVEAADPAVTTLADAVGMAMRLMSVERLRSVRDEMMTLSLEQRVAVRRPMSEQEYDQRTVALAARAAIARDLIAAEPETAARQLAEAHAALRSALTDPRAQLQPVMAAARSFSDAAKRLRRAMTRDPVHAALEN